MRLSCPRCGNNCEFDAAYNEYGYCTLELDLDDELHERNLNPVDFTIKEAKCTLCGSFVPVTQAASESDKNGNQHIEF